MSISSGSPPLDAALGSMDVLARQLDAFVAAWESAVDPPDLRPFLPADGEIRRMTLVELIKVDLEYRWRNRDCPKRLREYLAEFPEIGGERVPCDLIYEEFHIRKQGGQDVSPEEYLREFSAQAAELGPILGAEQVYESSSFYHRSQQQRVDGVAAGESIDDFDLLAELGIGAFAKVFLARQKSMQRLVALKVSGGQSTEPQTLAQLDHDHIVRVYDQRVLPEQKLRLLYMQYVAGGTLQSIVYRVRQMRPEERTGKLLLDVVDEFLEKRGESRPVESSLRVWLAEATWPEAVCWLGAKLADALDYAHTRGVLHRDVKPANVLLTPEGSPKLADFNISFGAKVAGATAATYLGGSLAYMSPEQLEACNPEHPRQADELDGRCDLYSLGVVLWELVAGYRPFLDEDVSGAWSAALEAMVERRKAGFDLDQVALLPGCPAGLPAAMRTTLEADRERRWTSGAEMARRLELCTDPKACELLFPPPDSMRVQLRRFAVLIIFVMAGVPNVLAGAFNYIHNEREIIPRLGPFLVNIFDWTQSVINGVAYSVGSFMFWLLARSVYKGLQRREARVPESDADRGAIRRRCLRLGHLVAVISIVEWSIAAYAYPACLRLAGGAMPTSAMLHFFFSLLLCGFVAASYPFFGITYFSLRTLYPALVVHDLNQAQADAPVLKQIGWWAWVYVCAAALVPFLSIGALVVAADMPEVMESNARMSMAVFIGVGLIGLPPIFWLFHAIQADLNTLSSILAPVDRRREHR